MYLLSVDNSFLWSIAGEPLKDVVIKAQVLAGGRGLGTFKNGFTRGVRMVTKPGQAKEFAEKMLGQHLVTKQAPDGVVCNKVFLMERLCVQNEKYLSIVLDRTTQGPLMVACPRGGTSIEDVAKTNPELIFSEPINIEMGLTHAQCIRMAKNLGTKEGTLPFDKTIALMKNLYSMFIACDCTQVEINPLVETTNGEVCVCDAKVNFDDKAKFRQEAIFAHYDQTQEDPRTVEANGWGLNYIALDGSLGGLINGAGLAMAMMDLVKLKGGNPANFLDVGGAATSEQIQHGFTILNNDSHVCAILVNIFGGITRCDTVARGIIASVNETPLTKPLVICLKGTNLQEANALIEECGFDAILASDLDDAAQKAVEGAKSPNHILSPH
jgi:succinyl-CoA synthetase beta subunit